MPATLTLKNKQEPEGARARATKFREFREGEGTLPGQVVNGGRPGISYTQACRSWIPECAPSECQEKLIFFFGCEIVVVYTGRPFCSNQRVRDYCWCCCSSSSILLCVLVGCSVLCSRAYAVFFSISSPETTVVAVQGNLPSRSARGPIRELEDFSSSSSSFSGARVWETPLP